MHGSINKVISLIFVDNLFRAAKMNQFIDKVSTLKLMASYFYNWNNFYLIKHFWSKESSLIPAANNNVNMLWFPYSSKTAHWILLRYRQDKPYMDIHWSEVTVNSFPDESPSTKQGEAGFRLWIAFPLTHDLCKRCRQDSDSFIKSSLCSATSGQELAVSNVQFFRWYTVTSLSLINRRAWWYGLTKIYVHTTPDHWF